MSQLLERPDMYLQHFGLDRNPFSLTPDPRFLFLTPKHQEALAALLFAVTHRKGFMVLTGDAGTGKTTLVRKLLLSIPVECAQFSVVVNPALTRSELLEIVLMDFGLQDLPSSKALRLRLFKQLLLRAQSEGRTSVIVIDEAHLLTADLMDEVRLLSNFETEEQKLVQIVLAGQSELNAVLQLDSMRHLRQRLAIRADIGPLSSIEVARYMDTRWRRAGSSAALPFSEDSIELIARTSAGIPRIVNVLCDAALVSAYGAGLSVIDSSRIRGVVQDLQLSIPEVDMSLPEKPAEEPTPAALDTRPTPSDQVLGEAGSPDRYLPELKQVSKLQRLAAWFGAPPTQPK